MIDFVSCRDLSGMHPIWKSYKAAGEDHIKKKFKYYPCMIRIKERSPVSCSTSVQYILNVTREIDNFFPGVFEYHNIRVYDEEATDLLAYWNDTYKFISRAK